MREMPKYFGRGERAAMELRGLFEGRGFLRAKVPKFEDYALYIENKNFLQTENIITFMDLSGRLMALKPDVTLSIVKNMPKQAPPVPEKLYYIDEVYRLSKQSREYKVHSQIGVEVIGDTQGFGSTEVLDLALESLRVMSASFVLDISHLGFVSGLLGECALDHQTERQAMESIHQKNAHDLALALRQAGVAEELAACVTALCELHGGFQTVLEEARGLIRNERMKEAWEELRQVEGAIDGGNASLNLDFSAVNDLDYYNGLIFRGYVEGISSVVLTGGRYDNLMHKMGKHSGAIGFAVCLDELGKYPQSDKRRDFDLLVRYAPESDCRALLKAVKELCAQGRRVRAERVDCDLSKVGFTYAATCLFEKDRMGEETPC